MSNYSLWIRFRSWEQRLWDATEEKHIGYYIVVIAVIFGVVVLAYRIGFGW